MGITPALLSTAEAADYLGVCRTTVWNLMSDGDIPPTKVRGRTLLAREALDEFIRRQTEKSVRRAKRGKPAHGQ